MAHKIPAVEPQQITAGDTATWKKSLSDYPANQGWVLAYALVNAAGKIEFTSSADGVDHLIDVAPGATKAYPSGRYSWQARVSDGAQEFTVGRGQIEVLAEFDEVTGGLDARSVARAALDKVNAWLKGDRSAEVAEYSIAGRAMKLHPLADLMVFRDKLRLEVRSEENAERVSKGLPSRNKIRVRFT